MAKFIVDLDERLSADLEEVARLSGRKVDDVASAAIADRVEYDLAYLKAIGEGLADIAAGRMIDHEEVVATAMARRAAFKAKLAG